MSTSPAALSPAALPIATSATAANLGSPAAGGVSGNLAGTQPNSRAQMAKVARDFEAIFVRQMLAQARKTNLDKDGLFSSQGSQTFMDMQDQRFADIAASKGTFGLGKMIEKQLLARSAASAPASAAASAPAVKTGE